MMRDWIKGRNKGRVVIAVCKALTVDTVLLVTPSPALWYFGHSEAPRRDNSNTSYLDGVRGAASLAVYIQHYATPFQSSIYLHSQSQLPWSMLQLPMVRLLYGGSFAVTLFFAISGFALSLRPLDAIYHGKTQEASMIISSSAFRRGFRLFVPPIATVLAMTVAVRWDAFNNDYPLPSDGKYNIPPPRMLATIPMQLIDALSYIFTVIIYPKSWLGTVPFTSPGTYGFQLWTISAEFWSSQILFLGLLATCKCRRRIRIAICCATALASMWCLRWEITLFFGGMILADLELHNSEPHGKDGLLPLPGQLATGSLFALGLYLGSMPDFDAKVTPGFRLLARVSEFERLWQTIGSLLVLTAISRSSLLQWIFNTRLLQYLGQISFALYLVHVPILSSLGWDIVPTMWGITGQDNIVRYEMGVVLGFILLSPMVIWVADVFWRLVDRPSVKLAKLIEQMAG